MALTPLPSSIGLDGDRTHDLLIVSRECSTARPKLLLLSSNYKDSHNVCVTLRLPWFVFFARDRLSWLAWPSTDFCPPRAKFSRGPKTYYFLSKTPKRIQFFYQKFVKKIIFLLVRGEGEGPLLPSHSDACVDLYPNDFGFSYFHLKICDKKSSLNLTEQSKSTDVIRENLECLFWFFFFGSVSFKIS